MNKFYYTVQNGNNKEQKEYLIGFMYGRPDVEETDILNAVQNWCKSRNFRLALLVQVFPLLPIVNQLYPFSPTTESGTCMEYVMQIMSNQ